MNDLDHYVGLLAVEYHRLTCETDDPASLIGSDPRRWEWVLHWCSEAPPVPQTVICKSANNRTISSITVRKQSENSPLVKLENLAQLIMPWGPPLLSVRVKLKVVIDPRSSEPCESTSIHQNSDASNG